ncbi:hypothetical protein MAHJHV55_54910 [Mycobacterium avium subsp. hominissuis]
MTGGEAMRTCTSTAPAELIANAVEDKHEMLEAVHSRDAGCSEAAIRPRSEM